MARMERLYKVNLAVVADGGNDGGGGWGGKAGAPGGNGIARVNGQAVVAVAAAAEEEEEEEGAADHNGNRAVDGVGGPSAHSNRNSAMRAPHTVLGG